MIKSKIFIVTSHHLWRLFWFQLCKFDWTWNHISLMRPCSIYGKKVPSRS